MFAENNQVEKIQENFKEYEEKFSELNKHLRELTIEFYMEAKKEQELREKNAKAGKEVEVHECDQSGKED